MPSSFCSAWSASSKSYSSVCSSLSGAGRSRCADGVFGRRKVELVSSTNPLGLDLADPAAKDDVITRNQLHLELNRETIIHVSSKDVIHSFKLPVMRAEQDAIPGMDVKIHFKPIKANDHGEMRDIAGA